MKQPRFNALDAVAVLAALSLVLYALRALTGGALGVELGAEAYVVGVGAERRALGNNREVVEIEDRIVGLAGRKVASLAEVGDVLRSLEPSEGELTVPVTLERYDYRFGESLNYREVQEHGFPTSIEAGDRVVGYDDHEVRGDIDRATILAILANRPAQRVTFYFERPQHQYIVELPVNRPRFPAGPVGLFAIAAVVAAVIAWRARRSRQLNREDTPDGAWLALAGATLAAPWALVLLWDPARALLDPILLLPSLLALAVWRPVALELHRRLFGGPRHPLITLATFLPAAVVGFVGLMLTLELGAAVIGEQVEAGRELDVIGLIRTACGMLAVYHLLDLVLWFRRAAELRRMQSSALLAPQIGLLISSLALISSLLFWVQSPGEFVAAGFVYHAAGLVLALWLGDMAIVALPPLEGPTRRAAPRATPDQASADLCDMLSRDAAAAGLFAPELIVGRGRFAVVMSCTRVLGDADADAIPEDAPLALSVSRAAEELRAGIGLLRDEDISLPLPPERPNGREEHSGEVAPAEELVRPVVQHLGVGTAFSLLDEAARLDPALPDATAREGTFWAWIVDYGAPNYGLEIKNITALRKRFVQLWPDVRQLILESLLREELDAPRPRPQVREEAAPVERVVEREVVREVPREVAPADYAYLRRDLAAAWPIDEDGLLEDDLDDTLSALAEDEAPVVVVGPPGVGKQFVARRLHSRSAQAEGPFICFPVSRIPSAVRDVELFGDEESDDDPGHLRAARGGALYIDDAASLGDELLDRLLARVGEVEPPALLLLAVRTPAGAHPDEALNRLGGSLGHLSRTLLAHRVVRLRPLEQRPAWVRALVDHYVMDLAMKHDRVITHVADGAMAHLKARRWPGGVPDLVYALEHAVLRCTGDTLLREHLVEPAPTVPRAADLDALQILLADAPDLRIFLDDVQARVYAEAVKREKGDKNAAARLLGVKRATLTRALRS